MKKLVSIIILSLLGTALFAGPADPSLLVYTQPDGSKVQYYLHGDEFVSWMTATDGSVIEIGEDGYVRPASAPSSSQFRAAALLRASSLPHHTGVQTGDRHVMVILVQYPDLSFQKTRADFEDLFNGSGAGSTGSVKTYFNEQSDGKFRPVFDIYGPVTLSNNRSTYKTSPNDALNEAATALFGNEISDSELNNYVVHEGFWAPYYRYYLSDVIMVFAGHSRASGDQDGIWPVSVSASLYEYTGSNGRHYMIDSYCCSPELQGASSENMAGIGHVCHEFCHRLGLPDFYDTNSSSHSVVAEPCLDYSLMESGSYNNSSKTPPPLSMFERSICGWADLGTDIPAISASGNITLHEIGQGSSKTRAFSIPTDKEGELFICEYRSNNAAVNKWSASLQRGGLLVYHVDRSDREISQDGYSQTAADWWSDKKVNNNGSHPLYYLVPSGDQTNLKNKDAQKVPFPGSQNVIRYNPVSWNNTSTFVALSGISYNAANTSMTLKAHVRSYPLINNPGNGVYRDGDTFTLKLSPGSEGGETVSKWYFDTQEVVSPQISLTSGAHTVEALLDSGKKLRLELNVN